MSNRPQRAFIFLNLGNVTEHFVFPEGEHSELNYRRNELDKSQSYAWGYSGSGPSHLSYALLREIGLSSGAARDFMHRFKERVIAQLDQNTSYRVTYTEPAGAGATMYWHTGDGWNWEPIYDIKDKGKEEYVLAVLLVDLGPYRDAAEGIRRARMGEYYKPVTLR